MKLYSHNCDIPCFVTIACFDDIRLTLDFGVLELRTKVTLQLQAFLLRHCEMFLIT